MPILNPNDEEFTGELAADPPVALRSALEEARSVHYDAGHNSFDYPGFARSPEYEELRAAAESLAHFDCSALGIGQRLPFWLNVYNALVLHAVVVRGVTDSVRSVGDFYGESKYEVGGLEFSLDDVEHGLLRANEPARRGARRPMRDDDPRQRLAPILFDERVHFAMYSACRSSPWLETFTEGGLDVQLESATRRYLSAHIRLDPGCKALRVPKIFDWYEADFGGAEGVRSFVITRLERDEDVDAVDRKGGRVPVKYLEYDWSLNSR
jgi:hypothetical protein